MLSYHGSLYITRQGTSHNKRNKPLLTHFVSVFSERKLLKKKESCVGQNIFFLVYYTICFFLFVGTVMSIYYLR